MNAGDDAQLRHAVGEYAEDVARETARVEEALAFSFVLLPVVVVISYVARLSTLARATVFTSPFRPPDEDFE